jgi:hypothetical protein
MAAGLNYLLVLGAPFASSLVPVLVTGIQQPKSLG